MTKHAAPKPTGDVAATAATGPSGIPAIAKDKCTDAGDGYVIATIDDDYPNIKRGDGTAAEVGDVLSMQPDGTMQARESGARGAYELAKPDGNFLVYRPVNGGRCWFVPLANSWPNV
jgi:hypothetical protein